MIRSPSYDKLSSHLYLINENLFFVGLFMAVLGSIFMSASMFRGLSTLVFAGLMLFIISFVCFSYGLEEVKVNEIVAKFGKHKK